jgi:hypothetical protein
MKKFNFIVLGFAFVFFFIGCNGVQIVDTVDNSEESSDSQKINLIATNAELLISQNKILSNLNTSARSATNESSNILYNSELSAEDIEELTSFSNSPSSYISENISLDGSDSEKSLNLLYSIYNESTVDEVISSMESVSSEMAEEYKESVSEFYNNLDSSARCAVDAHGGIGSQKLYLFQNEINDTCARSVTFATDLSWSSVARYIGYSTAAIAGASCYKWGFFPWIRYPGLAVCLSGIGCMGTLIARWACSPKLAIVTDSVKSIASSVSKIKNLTGLTDEEKRNAFLSDLKESLQNYIKANPDYESDVNKIITYIDSNYVGGKSFCTAVKDIINFCLDDGQTGMQLATVGVSTASVVAYCWFTGVVAVLQEAYFAIIDFIPSWLTITTNSISIVRTF